MERRLNKKVETYITTFKDSIREKATQMGLNNDVKSTQLLQYIYDYDRLSFNKEDFQKRKRVKNSIPIENRCSALRADGDRCTRKRKDGCEYLFTSNTGNKMDASCLYKMIKNVAKRSNLDEDVIENISTHSFRHTSITNMVNKGYDISKIALFHGHSDTKTTMGYIDKDAVSLTELVR